MIAEDLWQVHYQILLITSRKEFIKVKCKDCDCFHEYKSVKDNLIKYKRLSCNKGYSKNFDKKLKKKFKNTFKFFNNDINKPIFFLLRIGVYPHEYMDGWEKFNETALPKKEEFYSKLNMEEITVSDYMNGKKVVNILK